MSFSWGSGSSKPSSSVSESSGSNGLPFFNCCPDFRRDLIKVTISGLETCTECPVDCDCTCENFNGVYYLPLDSYQNMGDDAWWAIWRFYKPYNPLAPDCSGQNSASSISVNLTCSNERDGEETTTPIRVTHAGVNIPAGGWWYEIEFETTDVSGYEYFACDATITLPEQTDDELHNACGGTQESTPPYEVHQCHTGLMEIELLSYNG